MSPTLLLGAGLVALSIVASAAALTWGTEGTTRPAPRAESAPAREVLHRRTADFCEDEPGGRAVAALEARLEREGERTWLRLTASPAGPRVAPPAGPLGLAGSNRLSAQEIAALVAADRMQILAQGPAGLRRGTLGLGARADVRERRLHADGQVTHEVPSGDPPAREAVFELLLEGPGLHAVEVLVDGRPRVRVDCRLGTGESCIVKLEGLGAHDGEQP